MCVEIIHFYEALPTDITFIWSLCAVVYKNMLLHFRRRPEVLVTLGHGAFERPLSRVDQFMSRHRRGGDHLSAVRARVTEDFIQVFGPLVFLQGSFLFEGFLTLGARIRLLAS